MQSVESRSVAAEQISEGQGLAVAMPELLEMDRWDQKEISELAGCVRHV